MDTPAHPPEGQGQVIGRAPGYLEPLGVELAAPMGIMLGGGGSPRPGQPSWAGSMDRHPELSG